MKILVVAATIPEITGIYNHFGLNPLTFTTSAKFDLLVTGVGMTATAYAMGQHLCSSYDLVLNLGIAGCFDTSVPLGSLVHVQTDEFSELGAQDKNVFLPIDELGFGKSKHNGSYLTYENPALKGLTYQGAGITVNTVHGNKESISAIRARLNPLTESMEGAAVFYACEQASVSCIQVRSISNYVEERNKAAWKIGLAIAKLNEWAIEFLTNA